MASIFTKIIQGEIPSYKILEDDQFYAFLDINPNAKGHTLCVPKKEVNKLLDLDEDTYQGLMAFSRKASSVMVPLASMVLVCKSSRVVKPPVLAVGWLKLATVSGLRATPLRFAGVVVSST